MQVETTSRGTPRIRPPRRCSKCGKLGSRADQCGITHEPELCGATMRAAAPAVAQSAKAHRERFAPASSLPSKVTPAPNRLDKIAKLAGKNRGDDENPNASERWSKDEINEATELAESKKFGGELPMPNSSWGW